MECFAHSTFLQSFQKAASVDQETDDAIVPWIQGFIEHHGIPTAQWLLKDVGKVPLMYSPPTTSLSATERPVLIVVPGTTPTLQHSKDAIEDKIPTNATANHSPTLQPTRAIQLLPLNNNTIRTKAPLVLAEGVMSVEGDDEVAPPDKIDWDKAFP